MSDQTPTTNPPPTTQLMNYIDFYTLLAANDRTPLLRRLIDSAATELLLLIPSPSAATQLQSPTSSQAFALNYATPAQAPSALLSHDFTYKKKDQQGESEVDLLTTTWEEMNECAESELWDLKVPAEMDFANAEEEGDLESLDEEVKRIAEWELPNVKFVEGVYGGKNVGVKKGDGEAKEGGAERKEGGKVEKLEEEIGV